MRNGLLPGWRRTVISEVAQVFLGKTPAKADYTSSGNLKVVKFRDLQNGCVDFHNSKNGFVRGNGNVIAGLRELRRADVLITSAAHSGENIGKKCAYVSGLPAEFERVFFTGELLGIRCDDEILSRWIYLFFRSAEGFKEIQKAVTGVHLTGGRAKQMTVPLAPPNEQRRIVAKLEKLLAKVDAGQQRLANIPTLLKRFRQSVLAAACSGRLTADWRKENPNDVRNQCGFEDTPEIPESWEWKQLSEVSEIKGGVTKGRQFKGESTIQLPYLRVANVQDGYLDLREIKLIEVLPGDREKYALKVGDLLFTEGGDRDKLGRGSVWRGEIADCIHQNHIFRARLTSSITTPEYISLTTKSEFSRQYFFENASQTVNLASINLTMLSALPVPLPPLAEQQEIVRRVGALFALADQIEARCARAKTHADNLTQSILAKAFRGELVQTDLPSVS